MDKKILYGWCGLVVSTISLIGLTGFIGNYSIQEPKKLERKISIIADTNKDNATLPNEWAKVYNKFGIHYDVHSSIPHKDLTMKQMRKYLVENK